MIHRRLPQDAKRPQSTRNPILDQNQESDNAQPEYLSHNGDKRASINVSKTLASHIVTSSRKNNPLGPTKSATGRRRCKRVSSSQRSRPSTACCVAVAKVSRRECWQDTRLSPARKAAKD